MRGHLERLPSSPDLIVIRYVDACNETAMDAAPLLIKILPHVWLILLTTHDFPSCASLARSLGYMPGSEKPRR